MLVGGDVRGGEKEDMGAGIGPENELFVAEEVPVSGEKSCESRFVCLEFFQKTGVTTEVEWGAGHPAEADGAVVFARLNEGLAGFGELGRLAVVTASSAVQLDDGDVRGFISIPCGNDKSRLVASGMGGLCEADCVALQPSIGEIVL